MRKTVYRSGDTDEKPIAVPWNLATPPMSGENMHMPSYDTM